MTLRDVFLGGDRSDIIFVGSLSSVIVMCLLVLYAAGLWSVLSGLLALESVITMPLSPTVFLTFITVCATIIGSTAVICGTVLQYYKLTLEDKRRERLDKIDEDLRKRTSQVTSGGKWD